MTLTSSYRNMNDFYTWTFNELLLIMSKRFQQLSAAEASLMVRVHPFPEIEAFKYSAVNVLKYYEESRNLRKCFVSISFFVMV